MILSIHFTYFEQRVRLHTPLPFRYFMGPHSSTPTKKIVFEQKPGPRRPHHRLPQPRSALPLPRRTSHVPPSFPPSLPQILSHPAHGSGRQTNFTLRGKGGVGAGRSGHLSQESDSIRLKNFEGGKFVQFWESSGWETEKLAEDCCECRLGCARGARRRKRGRGGGGREMRDACICIIEDSCMVTR